MKLPTIIYNSYHTNKEDKQLLTRKLLMSMKDVASVLVHRQTCILI